MTTTGKKTRFISDIHLGDARSFAEPHPYGWFRNNIPHLKNFLTEQLDDDEVGQVVILGDLFEEWVIPTDQDPLISYRAVCDNPQNDPVIKPLRQLAAKGKVTYLQGNHDMTLSTNDIADTQKVITDLFPGINASADPNLPHGVYRRGRLVAEHGNRYALFNAADTWTNSPWFLPIGYFLSRLVAYKVSKTGDDEDFHDILARFVEQYKDSRNLIKDLFIAVAEDAGLKKTDPINMQGIAGFPVTVGAIGSLYQRLLKNWRKNRQDIDWRIALIGEVGDLYLAAVNAYFSLFGADQNIVIFGHTHKADLKKSYLLVEAPAAKDIHIDIPCRSIYANCGTWVDSAPFCTYVETEENVAAKRHYVRVVTYPDKTVLQEGFVKLT